MAHDDHHHMLHALSLARRMEGRTWPNPPVGCVVVKDGRVVGAAATAQGGRPHAETQALTQAGEHARSATAYVTLEPCAHHGRTPPCAEALIEAGVGRVVIACRDPDPRTDGAGEAMLRAAGIAVEMGVGEKEVAPLYAGYFRRVREGLPEVNVKIAASLDGRIAMGSGESHWITGEQARRFSHVLRARHDAILTGIGTVLADDPSLTCRLPGLEGASPVRVVLDSHLQIPLESKLVAGAGEVMLWVYCLPEALEKERDKVGKLKERNVELMTFAGETKKEKFQSVLRSLASRGIMRALVEAGSALSSTALESGDVSRLYLFHAPVMIGAAGLPMFAGAEKAQLAEALRVRRAEIHPLGEDMLEVYGMSGAA